MKDKYVGLDVHQSSTMAAVHDEKGKAVMESILKTEAEAIRDFVKGLSGTIHVTFEEGTQAGWLYEIVKPLVAEMVVCNPRANKLLAVGNKGDRVDAHKLAELLRGGQLKSVYHGESRLLLPFPLLFPPTYVSSISTVPSSIFGSVSFIAALILWQRYQAVL